MTRGGRDREAGLTLVELMISMVVASIAMGAALAVGLTMGSQFRDHREITQTERAARVALEMIADGIRGAGPGVPSGRVYVGGSCVQMGSIHVDDDADDQTFTSDPDFGGGTLTPREGTDLLEIVQASGGVYSTLRGPFDETTTSLEVTGTTGWRQGDYALVTNLAEDSTSVGYVVRVADTPSADAIPIDELGCGWTVSPAIGAGGFAIRVRVVRYFVADLAAGAPFLMMDLDADGDAFTPQPVAPGVEDLQLVVGIEDLADGDAILSPDTAPAIDDEWFGNFAGDLDATAIAQFPGDPAVPPWRAVRVSIVARALDPATDVPSAPAFAPKVLENHTPTDLTPDKYRRRVLQTTVDIRNLEGSP